MTPSGWAMVSRRSDGNYDVILPGQRVPSVITAQRMSEIYDECYALAVAAVFGRALAGKKP